MQACRPCAPSCPLCVASLRTAALLADTVLAAVAPRPPPKAVRDAVSGGGQEEEEEDPLRLRLPANAPAWKRNAVRFLRQRLHVPEALLALLLRVPLRAWLALAAWMAGARLAAAWELGPVYMIATILLLMLLNLGQRREGQWRWAAGRSTGMCLGGGGAGFQRCAARRCRRCWGVNQPLPPSVQRLTKPLPCSHPCPLPSLACSAYSLFNPGMRRLPGQMTAEDLDRQVRRGHM